MADNKAKIWLSPPHMSGLEEEYIAQAFASNWIAPLGPHVDAFEAELAQFVQSGGACALSSGTAALHLALQLLEIGPGDTVFCSSLTFVASANAIKYVGAEPVFIDSDLDSWNMCPHALGRAFETAKQAGRLPKAVIVVHIYGLSAKMDEIMALCHAYDVPLIEDAAESLGTTYKGQESGTMGMFGIYSFNGNKIITTSGGGMLVSAHTDLLARARFLAAQAKDEAPFYEHSALGFNYRLSNVLAGIGRAQLHVLSERVEQRRRVFDTYVRELGAIPFFTFAPELPQTRSNRWLTVLTIDEQAARFSVTELIAHLATHNIEARRVWKPLHLQPLYQGASFYARRSRGMVRVGGRTYASISEYLFQCGICLPSGSNMSEQDQERVIDAIKQRVKRSDGANSVRAKASASTNASFENNSLTRSSVV